MELAAEEPGMLVARKLHNLDELAVGRDTAKDEAAFLQSFTICRIEFVAMTMAFANFGGPAVNVARQGIFSQTTYPRAEAHRAAHLFDIHQIAQFEDDWIRRFKMEFSRIGVFEIA